MYLVPTSSWNQFKYGSIMSIEQQASQTEKGNLVHESNKLSRLKNFINSSDALFNQQF